MYITKCIVLIEPQLNFARSTSHACAIKHIDVPKKHVIQNYMLKNIDLKVGNCLMTTTYFRNSLQLSSSLPSMQPPDRPLHCKLAEMHFPLEHLNWLDVQSVVFFKQQNSLLFASFKIIRCIEYMM